ncbi:MAG: 2-oxoglutarate dehydrogenase E1 component, partial [SAR324 cluster bacterium]|nr:2-oxoglutarate dehydrogenase E1 component [SAR324 cluster bacterium]
MSSFLSNGDPAAIEGLYEQYCKNPESIDSEWRNFFQGFEFSRTEFEDHDGNSLNLSPNDSKAENSKKEIAVSNLIDAYRQRGHLFAKTNPVRARRKHEMPIILEDFGLGESEMDTIFQSGHRIGIGPSSLRDILAFLEKTYCSSVGVEYKFVRNPEVLQWLEEKMEGCSNAPDYSVEEQLEHLKNINEAVGFESFLHTKFVGQKRFSLEGSEAIIPALDTLVEKGAMLGVEEFIIGMAHRGRLNVLANILGKPYEDIFMEFEGKMVGSDGFDGDVKYHMGHSSDRLVRNGNTVHLSLTPNPSHLEAVNPVVAGISRGKIDRRYHGDVDKLVPILIHGDASIAGQGIVYEVLQMSQLPGYHIGGTVHVVLNNQVGFTADYFEGRSSTYCTDVAKTTLSPVFHVNGDDLDAVAYVTELALEFRQKFHRDVFVDILAYRRHGHNESDEPRFTQPALYKKIAEHPNPLQVYSQRLIQEGRVSESEVQKLVEDFKKQLSEKLESTRKQEISASTSFLEGAWSGIRQPGMIDFEHSPETGVEKSTFLRLAEKVTELPEEMNFFPKIRKLYAERRAMVLEKQMLDWGAGETMAFATLLEEYRPVRISGQDSGRGTFAHRHAIVTTEEDSKYVPLNHLSDKQAPFSVYNSLLSEYGVLGFEFGYAYATPRSLTIWEAQFGDFGNGAQIIFDQFISSAETKWHRMNGLVVLLPHGYEGQGPEHSSARIERYLELCADNNLMIINCTLPANMFHALRRQVEQPFRKPLIVFTPKSLLRHPKCVSPLEDFLGGSRFREVLDDTKVEPEKVRKVLFCSGKIYYELESFREEKGQDHVAIV